MNAPTLNSDIRVVKLNAQRDLNKVHEALTIIDIFFMSYNPQYLKRVLFNLLTGVVCDERLNNSPSKRADAMFFFYSLEELINELETVCHSDEITEQMITEFFDDQPTIVTDSSAIGLLKDNSLFAFSSSSSPYTDLPGELINAAQMISKVTEMLTALQALKPQL